jgi:hypothetical protein
MKCDGKITTQCTDLRFSEQVSCEKLRKVVALAWVGGLLDTSCMREVNQQQKKQRKGKGA